MAIIINQDGTAEDTQVIRKPVAAWRIELGAVRNEIDAINAHITKLQERRALLQARRLELKPIQDLPE